MKLRPYQQEGLLAVERALAAGINRQLFVLPTGGGKTVCFAQLPQRLGGRMLLLAHREELLYQAKEKILWANPTLRVEVEQANHHASPDADVVVASVPTLGREGSDRISKFDRDHFSIVVADEAHHAASISWRRVLDYFQPKLRIGFTATPQRGDNKRLTDVFDEIVHFVSIEDLIEQNYLVTPVGYRINTGIDISEVSTSNGDYAIGELSAAVNVSERNLLAIDAYKRFADRKKTITFCVDVEHAYSMADAFTQAGYNSQAILGETPNEERKQILRDFGAGRIDVLTSVGVLTEGFDEPSVECILFARPTKSQLLYSQAVGRGLRLFENKDHCIVLDLADATKGKKPVSLPTLMGLPPDFDTEGERLTDVVTKFRELEEKAPQEAARVKSVKDIEDAWERIDLFLPPPPNPELLEYTKFVWMETSSDTYILNLNDGERLKIRGDALGRYAVSFRHKSGDYELGVCESMEEAFRRSDKWVKKNRGEQLKLLDSSEQWRKEPPSDKQLKWLKKFNVPITSDLTKGQASAMLDKLFAENPKPKRSAAQEWVIQQKKRGY